MSEARFEPKTPSEEVRKSIELLQSGRTPKHSNRWKWITATVAALVAMACTKFVRADGSQMTMILGIIPIWTLVVVTTVLAILTLWNSMDKSIIAESRSHWRLNTGRSSAVLGGFALVLLIVALSPQWRDSSFSHRKQQANSTASRVAVPGAKVAAQAPPKPTPPPPPANIQILPSVTVDLQATNVHIAAVETKLNNNLPIIYKRLGDHDQKLAELKTTPTVASRVRQASRVTSSRRQCKTSEPINGVIWHVCG